MGHPPCRCAVPVRRHHGEQALTSQDHRAGLRALPLQSMECEFFDLTGDPPPVFVDAPLVGRAYGWALRSAIQDDTWS